MIDGDFATVMLFQSTPPVKAATIYADFGLHVYAISIHAAREGGDGVNAHNSASIS